jgi:RNA polymerase sigma-70 factor (ECF subfamily)
VRGADHQVDFSTDFSTTHWSVILSAGSERREDARQSLEALCGRYWFPLYAFVRREGYSEQDAQDLTQAFFARFLEKDYLHDVDRSRGRFRSFLLASLRHFLANARDHARAAKRGGGRAPLPLDFSQAEGRYQNEPASNWTPENLFHRRWALELLQLVLRRLEHEHPEPDSRRFFLAVEDIISGGEGTRGYAEIARDFDMTEGAVKSAVHRIRRRYKELLRDEIAQTVAAPEQIDEELSQLLAALRGD